MDKHASNSQDLRLHRKYVLVLCFIIFLLEYGEVTLQSVSLLGTSLAIGNRNAVFLGLWVLLIYSAFRYYQYFRDDAMTHFSDQFEGLQKKFYKNKFRQILDDTVYPGAVTNQEPKNKTCLDIPIYDTATSRSFFIKRVDARIPYLNKEEDNFMLPGKVYYHHLETDLHILKHFRSETFKAVQHFFLHKPHFWEYIFPLILFVFTFFWCGFSGWEGSLKKIFKEPIPN